MEKDKEDWQKEREGIQEEHEAKMREKLDEFNGNVEVW